MEVLKNLSESELTDLRDRFLRARDHALTMDEFEEVITAACASKQSIDVAKLHLRELFNDIDINGDNTVSWDEFTMFLISGEPANASASGDDRDLKKYNHVKTIIGSEIPNSVVETRYIPKLDKILRIMRREKSSRLRLCYPNTSLSTFLEVPRSEVPILSAEHIPQTSDVVRSGVLALSFSDSVVRFYETKASTSQGASPREMPLVRETKLLESQTIIRWSNRYNRLVMGSRTGVVSVLDVDQPTVSAKEKLHNLLVSDMAIVDDHLYTASLDSAGGSVKCVDLERSVVRFALDGHSQGATMLAVGDYHSQLFTAGFELHVLAYSTALPRLKPYKLDDVHRPHKGRIIGLQAVSGSPQVITADSSGLIKVWDLRMYSCVQNITPTKDDGAESATTGAITSIGFIPTRRRLVVNGRDTTLYEYDESGDPHLADDYNCTAAVYNPKSHSFLSAHDNGIKLWDAVTGAPRLVQRGIVPTDITCICLATPLCRRFFAGTMGGSLYNIGYAMGSVLRVYDDLLSGVHANDKNNTNTSAQYSRKHCHGSSAPFATAIVSLKYMECFRETDHPYVVVGMGKHVVLVPDAEEHVKRSILNLHCFDEVLNGSILVKDVGVIHTNFVAVTTTDGCIHVADLTSFALVFSYGAKQSLRGELGAMWIQSLNTPISQSSALAFAADATGKAYCIFASSASHWTPVVEWHATGSYADSIAKQVQERASLEGEGSSRGAAQRTKSNTVPPRKDKHRRRQIIPAIGISGEGTAEERPLSSRLVPSGASRPSDTDKLTPRSNSVVNAYFRSEQRETLFTSIVTAMAYHHEEGVLVTGDDKGFIALWDVKHLSDTRFIQQLESNATQDKLLDKKGSNVSTLRKQAEASSPLAANQSRIAFDPAALSCASGAPIAPSSSTSTTPNLINYWQSHDDEILTLAFFSRGTDVKVGRAAADKSGSPEAPLFILSTSLDKTICISTFDGVPMGGLSQGRTELDQEGIPSQRIGLFLVSNALGLEGWSVYRNYRTRQREAEDNPKNSCTTATTRRTSHAETNGSGIATFEGSASLSMNGSVVDGFERSISSGGRRAFHNNHQNSRVLHPSNSKDAVMVASLKESAGVGVGAGQGTYTLARVPSVASTMLPVNGLAEGVSTSIPLVGNSTDATVFLTDVTGIFNSATGAATPLSNTNRGVLTAIPIPPKLQGLVKADMSERGGGGGVSGGAEGGGGRGVGRLSSVKGGHLPPPLSHTTLPPIRGTSPRTNAPGSAALSSTLLYPTRIEAHSGGPKAYLRSNLCANAQNLSNSPRGAAVPLPLQASSHSAPSQKGGLFHAPNNGSKPSTPRGVRIAGNGGGIENPFETMKEYALRTKGNVVLGVYTEPSNRVI